MKSSQINTIGIQRTPKLIGLESYAINESSLDPDPIEFCGGETLEDFGLTNLGGQNEIWDHASFEGWTECDRGLRQRGFSNLNTSWFSVGVDEIFERQSVRIIVEVINVQSLGQIGMTFRGVVGGWGFNSMNGYNIGLFRFSGGSGIFRLYADTGSSNTIVASGDSLSVAQMNALLGSGPVTMDASMVGHSLSITFSRAGNVHSFSASVPSGSQMGPGHNGPGGSGFSGGGQWVGKIQASGNVITF